MQIIIRGAALTLALLASSPLLAAEAGAPEASSETSNTQTQATTEQEDCTFPALLPTDLSAEKLAVRPPLFGNTLPGPAVVDYRLNRVAACARALVIGGPGEGDRLSRASGSTTGRAVVTWPSAYPGL